MAFFGCASVTMGNPEAVEMRQSAGPVAGRDIEGDMGAGDLRLITNPLEEKGASVRIKVCPLAS